MNLGNKISVLHGNRLHQDPENLPAIQMPLLTFYDQKSNAALAFDENLLSRHMLLLGGIGTGKTNTFYQIIRQLRYKMNANDTMIIFDTKGDFIKHFVLPGDVVISNDDESGRQTQGKPQSDFWNIFNEISQDDQQNADIIEISKTLFDERIKSSQNPFFPSAAKDLFSALLMICCRKKMPADNKTISDLIFYSSAAHIRELLAGYPDLLSMTTYIADDRSLQTQGVMSELQQIARELFIGNFARPGSLSIRQLVRQKQGKAVFIEYDLGVGSLLTPIYRLLIDLAIKESLCRKRSEGNVWFIIDEFFLLPDLQHIVDGVNFGRSLGAKFIIGVQNVEQIYHIYTENKARSILSACSSMMAFHVHDEATRSYIKGWFGKNLIKVSYESRVPGSTIADMVTQADVIEDWMIMNLPLGQAIIGLPNCEPFVFHFAKY